MIRSFTFRVAVVGLAFVIGFGLAYGLFQASSEPVSDPSSAVLPDPLSRQSRPASSLLFVVLLLGIAAGVLWLGRRRGLESDEEVLPRSQGPHLILERDAKGRKRPPEFYEDLRERETKLESLEEKGPERRPRKVIVLPVGARRPMKSDR